MTWKVRVAYGKALRAPSAGQASGLVTGSAIQLANPDLKPERQDGWDGGLDLVFGTRGVLGVTGFDQTAKDLISFLQVASTPSVAYQYQNIGRVSNKGIELEGTLQIVQWLQVRGQYGYVRSRIEAVGAAGGQVEAGDEPVGVPTNTSGVTVTASPREGTTLNVGVTYVGAWRQVDGLAEYRCLASFTADACPASFLSTFSTRDFNITYPGFAKVNAMVSHRFTRQFEAFVSVDNLTNNESYEFSNASPVVGRTTTVGIQLTY
jgi:outer membrane receptor protein involved in Fe transport